jgi:predicted NBD/HSP70 family sugar kinase
VTDILDGPAAGGRASAGQGLQRRRTPQPALGLRPGANQYDLGSFNEATILETIRQAGSISRTEISERTGLTQQSVSRILRGLIERGLLAEGDQLRSDKVGKPRTPVRLRPEAAHAAGVLVDPERMTCVLAELDGTVIERRTEEFGGEVSPDDLVASIDLLLREMLAASGIDRGTFLGVGVATPGPITPDGDLLELPLSPAWRNVPLRRLLADRLNCGVVVQKDGEAAAIGERWIGRTRRAGDFVYLYFGTGIGSGLVLNGDVYRGTSSNAGEFGQLAAIQIGQLDERGRPTLVRECNPTTAIPEIAYELGYTGAARSYAEMCREVGRGVPEAVEAAHRVADVIARGAVGLIDLLDLPMMVVGGPAFEPELREIVLRALDAAVNSIPTARTARHVTVELSVLEGEAGAIGAASSIFHGAFAPSVRSMTGPRPW